MKRNLTFLGIETSCDETAASIVRETDDGLGEILSNIVSSQIDEHKEFGGVVPELAARAHVEKIEFVVKKSIKESNLNFDDLSGVAATAGPAHSGFCPSKLLPPVVPCLIMFYLINTYK